MGHPGPAQTDRIACPWLITKFIDPAAEILRPAMTRTARHLAGLFTGAVLTCGSRI